MSLRASGGGPDLVLLSGWGMDTGILEPFARQLARRRPVHIVDQPGYGASPWRSGIHDLDSLADAIAPAVPAGAAVLGWSLGGLVALRLARTRTLAAAILIGTTPRFVTGENWPCGSPPAVFERFRDAHPDDPSRRLDAFAVTAARGDRRAAHVLERLRGAASRPHPRALETGLDILAGVDLRYELGSIDAPALVVAGERDRLVPLAASRFLADRLPRGGLHVVPDASHAPFIGREAEIAARIDVFLANRAAA